MTGLTQPSSVHRSQPRISGVYVTQSSNSDVSAIYRSVPANPRNDSLYDLYARTMMNVSPPPYSRHARAAPISPADYALRFKARPTATPKVVGFDSGCLRPKPMKRGIEGFFPSVKLSQGSGKSNVMSAGQKGHSNTPTTDMQSPGCVNFEIAPSVEMTAHYYKNKSKAKSSLSQSNMEKPEKTLPEITPSPTIYDQCTRKYPYFTQTYPNVLPSEDHVQVGGDLSCLPRPKNFLARRDLPWIYRYKVKKNMNQLSKIMASRADTFVEETSMTDTSVKT